MGQGGRVRCRACTHGFTLYKGAGFQSRVVFCADCGRGANVPHFGEALGDGDPSACVGICRRCGGAQRLDAPPRCPKCRSTDLEEGCVDFRWD